jgi:hypothetical protein
MIKPSVIATTYAGLLDGVKAALELLLVLLRILASHKNLYWHFASLERLQVRSCKAP